LAIASWLVSAQSARGLAQSKTLRDSRSQRKRASVLECGGPPPLFIRGANRDDLKALETQRKFATVKPVSMSDPSETPSHCTPRQAGLLALMAVAAFHLAYTPAKSGLLAFAIVGYVICLIQLARLPTTRQCFYFALATGFACFAPQLECFWRIFGAFAIALWLILALWIAFFVVLTRLAITQLGWKRAAFLTPFFWTGLEYFRSELYYLKFSWLNVGYAFAESPLIPWLYQGVYGVGFGAAAIGAALLVWRWRALKWLAVAALVYIGAALLLASSNPPLGRTKLPLAGVQLEFPEADQIPGVLDRLIAQHPDAELLVLSEYTLMGPPSEELKEWCRANRKFLIVGGKDESPITNYYNTAFVISTNGEIVFQQVKSVPIQFFADGLPAPERKVWESPWGKIGIAICYDLSYTRVMDAFVRRGAQLLIIPTMDVVEWGQHQHELHARIAPVRAAEYGIPIFRVASSGISQGVNRLGQVRGNAPFPGEGEIIYFEALLGPKGAAPADRLLAPLSVFITVVFVFRTIAAMLCWKRKATNQVA
jgi:apolipoprotein N-acyltransferase